MIERKIYKRLEQWKERVDHKPLLVKGQRQVGKSFIIEEFAKNDYGNYIILDFNTDKAARKLFKDSLDPDSIVRNIEQYTDKRVNGRDTLLIFDEIQLCLSARSSLKSFAKSKKYDVIASGSLLGVAISRDKDDDDDSIPPVGFEEQITMYSCDFEEFLWAKGISKETTESIRANIHGKKRFNQAILERFSSLYREYLVVGGMPEAVQKYVDTNSISEVRRIQDIILNTITDDIIRYAPEGQKMRTLACYRSIPSQLSETNGKFQFSRVEGVSGRKDMRSMSENLLWISGAGYGNFAVSLTSPELPLESFEKRKSFKIYVSDTGLLVRQYGNDTANAVFNGQNGYNVGPVIENAVAESLTKAGFIPRWYRKNSEKDRMELDFVIPLDGNVGVIKVESGRDKDSTSLEKVSRFFDIGRKIMFENDNISMKDGVEHYPLFAAAFSDELGSQKE